LAPGFWLERLYPQYPEMRLRADLVQRLREIIAQRRLTQVAAAKLLGIRQPDLSAAARWRRRSRSRARSGRRSC
jgi:predicted XRE-type DNA-binding protein